jgi:O-antigen/teichoic acid export membrane protein
MEDSTLTYRTLKNISYGFLSFIIPIVFSIVLTPLLVRKLGAADYGIYILANTIVAILGLMDLGLTGAVTKFVAQYHSQNLTDEIIKITRSANSLFLIIGSVGLFVFFILGKFFLPVFKISGTSEQHIFIVFMIAGLTFFVNCINSVYTTVPAALQRFDIVTKLNLTQLAVFSFGSLGLVLLGFQLKAIVIFNLLTIIAVSFVYRFFTRRLLPNISLRMSWSKEKIKTLYGFGLLSSLSSISISSLNNLDRVIIPIFLGPVQLSYYSLPGNVAQKTAMFMGSITHMFFPLATSISALGEVDRLSQIFRKLFKNLAVVVSAITISIMLYGFKILYYWLGPSFAENGFIVLQILAATYFILALFGILYQFLLGMGQEKFLAKWSIIMAVINLTLVLLFIKPFGIVGAAWAYLAGSLPIIYLYYKTEKKIFKATGIAKFYGKVFFKLLVTSGVYFILVHYLILPRVNGMLSLVIVGPLSVILFMVLYRLLGFFEPEDLEIFRTFGGKILEKLGIKKRNLNETLRS